MHTQIVGALIDQHPLVSQLLKWAFHLRLQFPRYTETWEISKVMDLLSGQDVSHKSSLKGGVPAHGHALGIDTSLEVSQPFKTRPKGIQKYS